VHGGKCKKENQIIDTRKCAARRTPRPYCVRCGRKIILLIDDGSYRLDRNVNGDMGEKA
jgi:hypothetical protein